MSAFIVSNYYPRLKVDDAVHVELPSFLIFTLDDGSELLASCPGCFTPTPHRGSSLGLGGGPNPREEPLLPIE